MYNIKGCHFIVTTKKQTVCYTRFVWTIFFTFMIYDYYCLLLVKYQWSRFGMSRMKSRSPPTFRDTHQCMWLGLNKIVMISFVVFMRGCCMGHCVVCYIRQTSELVRSNAALAQGPHSVQSLAPTFFWRLYFASLQFKATIIINDTAVLLLVLAPPLWDV